MITLKCDMCGKYSDQSDTPEDRDWYVVKEGPEDKEMEFCTARCLSNYYRDTAKRRGEIE